MRSLDDNPSRSTRAIACRLFMPSRRVQWPAPTASALGQSKRSSLRHFGSIGLAAAAAILCLCARPAIGSPADYFVIQVVDEQTGRGVPLVELRTTDEVAYITDSNGIAVFSEPGLMNRKVYFTITSPGYEYKADGFGYHGAALRTVPGARATLKIKRTNIAERLYRQTGAGIYRDSVLAGIPVPLRHPLLNGDVVGQDSVLAVPYKGTLRWFWGDTSRPDYPLGNFGMSGATSPVTSDPDRGVDFTYFTNESGFSRPMINIPGPHPVWISGISTIEDGTQLIGYYAIIQNLGTALERGLAVYNDGKDVFERAAQFDAAVPLPLDGHPFLGSENSIRYLVGTHEGAAPLPVVRVPAKLAALKNLEAYESYTCLKPAAAGQEAPLERDAAGRLIYGWKRHTPCLTTERQRKLIASGLMKPDEALVQLRDVETGKSVQPHGGSVYWNSWRKRWVMVFGQAGGGVSNVGEIWYAEADTAVGPWIYARKVATHPKMDFYNPTQHPFFDQQGGRRIYFEGTYVNTFSGNPIATPRYNYNQILYRLNLEDPRLSLPSPVYRLASGKITMRDELKLPSEAADIRAIPFYAVAPARPHAGLIALYRHNDDFATAPPGPAVKPLCYIVPPTTTELPATMPLTDRQGRKLGLVWRNPQTVLTLDFSLIPAPDK